MQTGLTLGADLNKSNQNFWDGMETYTYSDDVGTKKYFDYYAYNIQPEISYDFSPVPVTLRAYYSFHKTNIPIPKSQKRYRRLSSPETT